MCRLKYFILIIFITLNRKNVFTGTLITYFQYLPTYLSSFSSFSKSTEHCTYAPIYIIYTEYTISDQIFLSNE